MNLNNIQVEFVSKDKIEVEGFNFTKMFQILNMTDTPKRRDSYAMSRLALLNSLKPLKVHTSLDNLILIENSQIYSHPHITASVSHTNDIAVGATSLKSNNLSLGVDIERSDRQIKDGADKYFCNDRDSFDKYSLLEKWVIKEACYKAFSNLLNKDFLLKDISCQEVTASYEKILCNFELIKLPEHTVAIAYVPNI